MYYRDTHNGNDKIFNFGISNGSVTSHPNNYNNLLTWIQELDKEFSKMASMPVYREDTTTYAPDEDNPSIKYKNFNNEITYTGKGTVNSYLTVAEDSSDCNIKRTTQNYLSSGNDEDWGAYSFYGSKTSTILTINNQMGSNIVVRAGKCTIQLVHDTEKVTQAGQSDEQDRNEYSLSLVYRATGHKTPATPEDEITYIRINIVLDLLQKEVTSYSVEYKINNTAPTSNAVVRINTIEME